MTTAAPRTIESPALALAPMRESTAAKPRPFLERHAVLCFYSLAFAISWLGILVVIGGPVNFQGTSEQIEKLFLPVMLAWLAGPSLASLLMTGLVYGRTGYRELLVHFLRWRVGLRWYAIVILTAPAVYVALCGALSLVSPTFTSSILVTPDRSSLLLMGLAYGLLGGGLLEELGWTGFAVPRLRQTHGPVATGLIVGVLWAAYHFSVIFWSTVPSPTGALGLSVLFAQLFAWLPAYRLLMVWVYDRTQSLLLAMLMHASATAGMLILQPVGMAGGTLLTWLVAFAATWWLITAIIALAVRHRNVQRFVKVDQPTRRSHPASATTSGSRGGPAWRRYAG